MSKVRNTPTQGIKTAKNNLAPPIAPLLGSLSPTEVGRSYSFLNRVKNPEYDDGIVMLPFRSCLRHDKAAVLNGECAIKTKPKWFTDLYENRFDKETGEVIGTAVYRTNELKSSNARKVKALDKFANHFQPLYEAKKVSLFFITLSQANLSGVTIKECLEALKKRIDRHGNTLLGFVWTAEISPQETKVYEKHDGTFAVSGGLHYHYHICIAVNRMDLRGQRIPKYLKLDGLWGRRTQIEFVKKNVRFYMAKYFAKHDARAIGKRSFGVSRNFKPLQSK